MWLVFEIFFDISSKFWPRGNTVWPLLSFQGSHILPFQGSNKNFNLKLIYFLVFKSFFKKKSITDNAVGPGALRFDPYSPSQDLIKISTKNSYSFWCSKIYSKNCIRDNMVWPILSFQGSYINVHLTLIHFLVLKTYWKIVSGTLRFDHYFPFQGFYQVFIKRSCFFSASKVFEKFGSQTI